MNIEKYLKVVIATTGLGLIALLTFGVILRASMSSNDSTLRFVSKTWEVPVTVGTLPMWAIVRQEISIGTGLDYYSVELVDRAVNGVRQVIHGSVWDQESSVFQFMSCEGRRRGEPCKFEFGVSDLGVCKVQHDRTCIDAVLSGIRADVIMASSPPRMAEYTYRDGTTITMASL